MANAKETHLYVIQAADHCKVGVAYDPTFRLMQLQVGSPIPMVLVASRPCPMDYAAKAEHGAHRLLGEFWLKGEWFAVTPDVAVDAVERALPWAKSGGQYLSDLVGPEPDANDEGAWKAWRAKCMSLSRATLRKTGKGTGAKSGSIAAAATRARLREPKLDEARPLWGLPPGEVSGAEIAKRVRLSLRLLHKHLGTRTDAREAASKATLRAERKERKAK